MTSFETETAEEQAVRRAQALQLQEVMAGFIPPCPDCKTNESVIQDDKGGIIVCTICGTIVSDDLIAQNYEKRTFKSDSGNSKEESHRVGGPDDGLLGDIGLGTIIGEGGKKLFKVHDNSGLKSNARALIAAFDRTSVLAERLHLPKSIVRRSNELYKRVQESKEFRGSKTKSLVTACLFISCRQASVPRTIKEICEMAGVRTQEVGRCFKKIKKLKLYKKGKRNVGPVSGAVQLIDRFCSKLKVPTLVKAAKHAVSVASKRGYVEGKAPATLAGGVLFMICNVTTDEVNHRNLKEISSVTHMAPLTIRGAYKLLYPYRLELVPGDFADREIVQNLPRDL